jgi:hypothetical protein
VDVTPGAVMRFWLASEICFDAIIYDTIIYIVILLDHLAPTLLFASVASIQKIISIDNRSGVFI